MSKEREDVCYLRQWTTKPRWCGFFYLIHFNSKQNAGIREAIINDFPLLLHIHCTAHTVELLLGDIIKTCPPLKLIVEGAHKVVVAVMGHKHLLKRLFELQHVNHVQKPLKLLLSNNTRKWYACRLFFLC